MQDSKFCWSSKCRKAFDNIKEKLKTIIVLRGSKGDIPFHIHTHASNRELGAFLRKQESKESFSIYYINKNMLGAQLNYTVTENEFLAILYGINKFGYYITGYPVFVHTNHSTIIYIIKKNM
jgi:hypothetical protein